MCQRYCLHATIVLCIHHCKWVAHVNLLINGDDDDDDDDDVSKELTRIAGRIDFKLPSRRRISVTTTESSTSSNCDGEVAYTTYSKRNNILDRIKSRMLKLRGHVKAGTSRSRADTKCAIYIDHQRMCVI